MRIAFVVSTFPVVSETFVVRQVEGLRRRGHDVVVIAGSYDADANRFFDLDVPVRLIRKSKHGTPTLGAAALALRSCVSSACRRRFGAAVASYFAGNPESAADIVLGDGTSFGRFDAVIAHFGPAGVRATALQAAGLLDGPLATIFHGFDMSDRWLLERYGRLYKLLYERNALLLPISSAWRARLASWGAPEERLELLRMGIDLDELPLMPLDRPLATPLRVLSVARLVEKKGLSYAVDAVSGLEAPVEYDIIGSGPLETSLRRAAAASSNPVRLLGRQPNDIVLSALTRADVFLLPSVTARNGDMEGVPVSLMEAMAVGAIVVSTRHSGIPELVADGVNGLLVDERDAAGIAQALRRITSGEIDLERMRAAARATVARRFNNETLIERLEELCRRLAALPPRVSRAPLPPARAGASPAFGVRRRMRGSVRRPLGRWR